jgi:zinc/manganese transport system substrate-binding protein
MLKIHVHINIVGPGRVCTWMDSLKVLLAIAYLAATILLVLTVVEPLEYRGSGSQEGLLVVVLSPGVEEDLAKLLCSGDRVTVMARVEDPHVYQLRPSDTKLLAEADIIVVLEHHLAEDWVERVTDAVIVGAADVAVRLYPSPNGEAVNLHGVYYDPINLASLIVAFANEASELRPECSWRYLNGARSFALELKVLESSIAYNVTAIAESPELQYALEWMGVRVLKLLRAGHDSPLQPSLVLAVEELVSSRAADLIAVVKSSSSSATNFLRELAHYYGVPVVEIPSPTEPGSLMAKLLEASRLVGGVIRGDSRS